MAKKKQVQKLNSKKLEDRIAPGMVGGGLVDPGMVDAVEIDSGSDGVSDSDIQTQSENLESAESPQGEYLDDASQPMENSGESQAEGEVEKDSMSEEFDTQDNYDEFSQDETQSDFVEEQPTWQEPDWVTANADGSVDIQPPEGVTVDPDAGIANFPMEVANEELPLPDDMQITAEGGLQVQLPEGSEYLEESNQLLLQNVPIEEIPEDLEAFPNADGSIMVNLPEDGIHVDPEAGNVSFDNYWANELTPENIEIQENGSVDVKLPDEGIEYNNDGSLHISAEANGFVENPPLDYYAEADYCECHPDGSVTVNPPEGVNVDGGIADMSYEIANEQLELPQEFELNSDGTSTLSLPEGCEFNGDVNGLVFPEGEINLNEIPEGVDAHVNPDGSITVMLQDGMNYDGDSNSVTMDNYWTNEITPDSMNIESDGNVQVALPEGTEFYEDGSFTIPAESADFMETNHPEYVHDLNWSEPMADGGYTCRPPDGMTLDTTEGTLTLQGDMIDQHLPIDDGMIFHADGTMDVKVPEGTEFNASLNQLTFPEGEVNINELPSEVNPQVQDNGSITVTLQDGMNFDEGSQTVHMDNYWTNELTPEPIEYTPQGEMIIDLPHDCEYHDDGTFTITEGSMDFIENPDPAYVNSGPDWVAPNPDGSVSLTSTEHYEANADEGNIQMNTEYINEGFDHYIPEGIEFNPDGTMDVKVPEGTSFDSDANALTFPAGEMHMNEIPSELNAELHDDGSITVNLQSGMEFNPETQEVHCDNYWTNELTPDCVEFSPEGTVQIDMPHDCHFFEDGSVHIPADSCDFVENPYPEYIDHGPDWVSDNPDGSVTVQPPEGVTVNAEEGYLSMSADLAMQELGGDLIPENIEINSDGSVTMNLPPEMSFDYNSESGAVTLTETPEHFNVNEIPEFVEVSFNDAGQPVMSFPDGVEFDHESGALNISNEMVNEIAPEPIEITADGEFKIQLPEDTQYFEDQGSFVISSESADFLDEAHDHENQEEHLQQAS